MLSLYELNDYYYEALEMAVDQDTGEVIDSSLFHFLNEIREEKESKVLNIACLIKSLKAESQAIKEEKDNLNKRQKALENKADRLKYYIEINLAAGEKYKNSRAAISWRKSTSVLINKDPDMLPVEFQKIKIEADKKLLKQSLEDGQEIEGVELVKKNNLQIK